MLRQSERFRQTAKRVVELSKLHRRIAHLEGSIETEKRRANELGYAQGLRDASQLSDDELSDDEIASIHKAEA